MSCKVKQQALNTLEKEGATKNGVVTNFDKFDRLNAELTQTASEKYEVGTGNDNLFSVSMDTTERTVIPNEMLFNALDKAVAEYKKNNPKPAVIRDRLSDIEPVTDELIEELYKNYVGLMGRNADRQDKALELSSFKGLINSTNVYKFKDTYIFGNYDVANNVFIVTLSSSPSSKELLAEALPNIVDNFDVIGSAPADVVEKYKRSGYVSSTASYKFNFKGEKMDKFLYASNPEIAQRIFGKDISELTSSEVENISHRIMPLPEYTSLLAHLAYKKDNMDINFVNEKLKNLKVPAHRRRYFIKQFSKSLTEAKKYEVKKILTKYGYPSAKIDEVMTAIDKNARTKGEIQAVRAALNDIGVTRDKQHTIMKQYDATNKRYNKANMAYHVKKLYDYRKVQIDEKDVNTLNRKAKEGDTALNKLLVNYLSHFGIKVEYLQDIQNKLGIDSLGTVDILNKIAYVDKNNTEQLPEMAGRFIAYMLQHNPNMATLLDSMKKVGRYKKSSKEELIEVAGELIAEQLHKKSKTEIPASLAGKIKVLIDYFMGLLSDLRMAKINREIGFIADNVLVGNQALILASKYKPGDEGSKVKKVNLHDAIEGDPFADEVVNEMAEEGFILTGSTVLAEQGNVLRPEGNQMHDIDWVSPFNTETSMAKLDKLYPNRHFVRTIVGKDGDYNTYTFLHSPKGTTIANVSQAKNQGAIEYYDVLDVNGKIVGTYSNRGGIETHTGIEAKPIDVFIDIKPRTKRTSITSLNTGTELSMSNWREVFNAKLTYGRLKDIWDYNRFIPNEYINEDVFESKLENLKDDSKQPFLNFTPVSNENQTEEVEDEVDYTSMNELILFNNDNGPFHAADVLNNIKNNFPHVNDNTLVLFQKLLPILARTNATIKFVSENDLKASDTFMQYNAAKNEIQIAKSKFKDASPEFVVQGFLHEVVHSVTVNAYLRPVTMEEQIFRDFIDKQFAKYSKLAIVEEYGLTNPVEFMAEAITNKDFQEHMIALDKQGETFWSKLVDMIRMLFGLPKSPNFENVVESITTIIQDVDTGFKGIGSNQVFEFKEPLPNVPSFETLEDRATYILDRATDNLMQAAKRVRVKGKDAVGKQKAKEFREHLNDLREEMEEVAKTEQFKAIVMYAKSLRTTVQDLKGRLDKADKDADDFIEVANHFQKYLDSYDMMKDINDLLSEARTDSNLTEQQRKDVDEINQVLGTFERDHTNLVSDIAKYKRNSLIPRIASVEFFPEIEYKWSEKLSAMYDPLTANGLSKTEWITQQMIDVFADDIRADLEEAAKRVATEIDEDITTAEARLSDPLNANSSKIFQLAVGIVAQMRNRINEAVLDFEFVLDKAFDKLKEGSKTMIPSKRYKHMLDQDLDGNYYLIGEYSAKWKQLYEQEYLAYKQELADIRFEGESMGMTAAQINSAENYREVISKMRAWEKEHSVGTGDSMKPHPKYKNDLSKLSEADKEFIALFESINNVNIKKFGKHASLRTVIRGVQFHKLPAISKSNHERMLELDGKGIIKDNFKDATQVRTDDVGFAQEALDNQDKPLKDVRVHYRGAIDPNEQSLDLPTLLRLEHLNGVNYAEKSQSKIVLDELVNISGNKKYIATSERSGQWLVNLFRKKKDVATVDGKDSVTYKRMQSYIDTQIHDILNVHAGFSIAGADVNKVAQTVSSYTAVLGMAANVASGTVNVLNGFSQLYIETFGGNHINIKSLTKAEGMYFRDMPHIFADLGRPVKKSVTNQLNQMFDVFGGFSVAEQEFFKDTIAKRLATFKTLSSMQDMGEHMMQSILTMAVLDGLKVMNEDGRFINKKGEVVDEKNAASMLDMMKVHESGKLYLDESVYYTPHTRNVDFYNGGQAHISLLIKKKIFDTAGVYDSNFQPDIYRNWYGKMLLLFKRFLISQMQNRWQGFSTIHKNKADLNEKDLQFNIGLKSKVEGTHVTALRLFIGDPRESMKVYYKDGVIPMLKSLKLAHLPENFKNLTPYERANLAKATADILTTAVLLPVLGMLIEAMADGEDEEYIWFLAYIVRRLESELSQFRNPKEAWRITEQPVAGTRVITNGLSFLTRLFSIWGWGEEDSKGDNKLIKSGEKMVPVWIQFKKEWKSSFNYINNQAN